MPFSSPVDKTAHFCEGLERLFVLCVTGLPYLNVWQLPGNGMGAFDLAKEATIRALDAPVVRQTTSVSGAESTAIATGGGGSSRSSRPAAGYRNIGRVQVSARDRRVTGDDGMWRSKL